MEEEIEKKLSPLEKKVLSLQLTGLSYTEIAKILDKPPKSIDNAQQRIRMKIRKILQEIG